MSVYRFSIELTDLRFHAYIGVLEQERNVGNEFRIDLSVDFAATDSVQIDQIEKEEAGVQSDELMTTVSYADIYALVAAQMKRPRKLLETVAMEMMDSLKHAFPQIESAKIRIEKSTPPIPGITGSAAVSLSWKR